MNSEKAIQNCLPALRVAASTGRQVVIENQEGKLLLGGVEGAPVPLPESVNSFPVVGCDLVNYSGLTDVEQLVVGQCLEARFEQAFRDSGLKISDAGISGTGDGVLLGLRKSEDILAGFQLAVNLWIRGNGCFVGSDSKTRGLRVVLTHGPWCGANGWDAKERMYGYGLIDAARIMACDKGQHFLISDSALRQLRGTNSAPLIVPFADGHAELRLGRHFVGKGKAADLRMLSFYNSIVILRKAGSEDIVVGEEDISKLHEPC